MSELTVGKKAPLFSLNNQDSKKISLKSFKEESKKVVLYFYPKDDTPGCTQEAKDFNDLQKKFLKKNTTIIGISPDSIESHQKFIKKYKLNFDLLSDKDHKIAEKYGVWVKKNMYGKEYFGVQRTTFLIDEEGKIAAIWPKVKVAGHCDIVLGSI